MNKKIALFLAVLVIVCACLCACKVQSVDAVQNTADTRAQATPAQETPAQETEEEYIDAEYVEKHYENADMSEEEYRQYVNDLNVRQSTGTGDQDEYQTDPVPEGMPTPVEWQDVSVDTSKPHTCTLYIECTSILENLDRFNADKMEVLPADGIVYARREVVFYEGESVFDVLLRETQQNRIHMEYEMTPIYNSNYIEGINNLYEFDCGELSGWMYCVNGWYPNYGCSRYQVKAGDVIEWHYTCDLGRDLGVYWIE